MFFQRNQKKIYLLSRFKIKKIQTRPSWINTTLSSQARGFHSGGCIFEADFFTERRFAGGIAVGLGP